MNFDLKKTVLILLGVMVLSFTIAGSIMGVQGLQGTLFSKAGVTRQQDINVEKTFQVDGIKEIKVNTVSTEIRVIPVDSGEIKVHYYGYANNSAGRPAPELIAEQNGSYLNLQVKHKVNLSIGFNFSSERLNLDIYVPKTYNGNLDTNTVSGGTNIEGLTLENLKSNSVSGSINGKSLSTKSTTIDTTSGSIDIKGFIGALQAHTVSGSVDIDYKEFLDNAKINTVSGEANLRMPGNAGFTVDFSSVSGNFKSEFPITTQGSSDRRNIKGTVGTGGAVINFHSTSGGLDIRK